MKKVLFLSFMLLVFSVLMAQPTFVSTEPSNRNVILEEFTGTSCGYCPDGHKVANQIAAAHPNRFWVVNIHQGGFAGNNPDYKTEFGDAIAGQSGLTGYPAGTVNRGFALGRDKWASNTNAQLNQSSPVNVAAKTTVDYVTRKMTVVVEVYYTANGTPETNKLNVALLQNEILGPQSGMNLNPDYIVGNQYKHMHMLRHLVTGQWGVEIPSTTEGSFFTQTFEYDIPENYRNVPVILEDLEVVVFVAQGNKTIETGCKSEFKLLNFPAIFPKLLSVENVPNLSCDCLVDLEIEIENRGGDDITSLRFDYYVSGNDIIYRFDWEGDAIPLKAKRKIKVDGIKLTEINKDQVITIGVSNVNGSDFIGDKQEITVYKDVRQIEQRGEFILVTDKYGSDNTFKFTNPDGSVLLEGGPWENLPSAGTTERKFDFIPTMIGCHQLEVKDANGDGINTAYGEGYFKLINYDGTVAIDNDGKFGKRAHYLINVPTLVGIADAEQSRVVVFPNPAKNYINIIGEYSSVSLIDINGKVVRSVGNEPYINVSDLDCGVYVLLVSDSNSVYNTKVVIKR